MSLQTFGKFSYHLCEFSLPIKHDTTYFSEMLMNGKSVYIQLPKLTTPHGIHWYGDRCYLDLELSSQVLDFFVKFEQSNIHTATQNSKSWFGKEIPSDIIDSNYLSSIRMKSKPYIRFSIPVNENTPNVCVYNQYKERINPVDITPGCQISVIIKCKGMVIGKRNISFDWHIEQVKSDTNHTTPYMFVEDDDEVEMIDTNDPLYEEKQFEEYYQGQK